MQIQDGKRGGGDSMRWTIRSADMVCRCVDRMRGTYREIKREREREK